MISQHTKELNGTTEILSYIEAQAATEQLFNRAGLNWAITGYSEAGLNVFFHVKVVRPRGRKYQVTVPWLVQEACPGCQGQGLIYAWSRTNSAYENEACPDCGGSGLCGYASEIDLYIDDLMCGQPLVRKRKAGRFNPRLGQRGDLIIYLNWVDEMPPAWPESNEYTHAAASRERSAYKI